MIGGFERYVTFGHFRCWSRFNEGQYRWRVQSRLAVKSMACTLTTPGMKWGNGVGAAAHEPPRGQEDKNMGCDGGLRRLYCQTVPPCATDARGEETGNEGGKWVHKKRMDV